MRIIFKILAAPFVPILLLFGLAIYFLLFLSKGVLSIASFALGIGGVVLLVSYSVSNGIVTLIMAFILFLIPLFIEWIAEWVFGLCSSVQCFLSS